MKVPNRKSTSQEGVVTGTAERDISQRTLGRISGDFGNKGFLGRGRGPVQREKDFLRERFREVFQYQWEICPLV